MQGAMLATASRTSLLGQSIVVQQRRRVQDMALVTCQPPTGYYHIPRSAERSLFNCTPQTSYLLLQSFRTCRGVGVAQAPAALFNPL